MSSNEDLDLLKSKKDDTFRSQLWNNLSNIKFKTIYTSNCARKSQTVSNLCSFFIAIVSSTSIAAWSIWQKVPSIWAFIIAISQFIHIAKSFIPLIKNETEYIEMSFEFESLYLEYEELWHCYENLTDDLLSISNKFQNLRRKEYEIEKAHKQVFCPESKKLISHTQDETYKFLSVFLQGDLYGTTTTATKST